MVEPPEEQPAAAGRVVALDYGKVRVGVAVSDELGMLAHPRPAFDGSDRKQLLAACAKLAKSEEVTRFLVGLPLSMSGDAGVVAKRAIRFCQQLADATGVEVELIDERLTSVQAERQLAEAGASKLEVKKRVDGAAAAIILQQWLDGQRPAPPPD